jgi:DNA-binding CsgD family transcriptional regulator
MQIMKKLYDTFCDKAIMIMLCDTQGYVIHLYSRSEVLQWFFERGIKLGTCMDYVSCGVNAISLGLISNSPVEVLGYNHASFLNDWDSVATIIRTDEIVLGVIGIFVNSIDNVANLCPLIELISDLITIEFGKYEKTNPYDKVSFFGTLILESKLNFTLREIEVLYLIYIGKGLNSLPALMNVSHNTIKTYLKNIYSKLGVSKLADCIACIHNILNRGISNRTSYKSNLG